MKLTFQKTALLNGINIVLKAVPSKTTMPILECILIDASTDEIKLTANDMELGIETKVEGDILEKGKIALDAKLFSEIARKLSDSDSLVTILTNFVSVRFKRPAVRRYEVENLYERELETAAPIQKKGGILGKK